MPNVRPGLGWGIGPFEPPHKLQYFVKKYKISSRSSIIRTDMFSGVLTIEPVLSLTERHLLVATKKSLENLVYLNNEECSLSEFH